MQFLKDQQLNLMLILSGICGVFAIFSFVIKVLSAPRKKAFLLMDISAMLLMIADRFAYIYRGDISRLGYWMVRICNFLVFALTLCILFAFNRYLEDLFTNE